MNTWRRTTAYLGAAALLLAAALLSVSPALAHYTRGAQWRSQFVASGTAVAAPMLSFDGLASAGDLIQAGSWAAQPHEETSVILSISCAQGDGSAAQQLVEVAAQSSDETLLLVSAGSSQAMNPGGTYSIPINLQRTETLIDRDTPVSFTVTASCNGTVLLQGTCQLVLKTTGVSPEQVPVTTLFGSCMSSYDPTQNFCVGYTIPTGCIGAEMYFNGTAFPAGTRYSTDGGVTYATLLSPGAIPLENASRHLLVNLGGSAAQGADLPISVTLKAHTATQLQTQTVELAYEKWGGDLPVITTEDGAISGVCVTWGGEHCTAEVSAARLQRSAPQAPQQTGALAYAAADSLFTAQGTTVTSGETGFNAEYRGVATNEVTPAGSYLLTVRWHMDGICVAEKAIPFFVHR